MVEKMTQQKAITLLSGGIDSAVASAIAVKAGWELTALSFNYGQRHKFELEAAKEIASFLKIDSHIIFPLPIYQFGGSSLLGEGDIPKGRTPEQIATGIPSTYVPGRNLVFLSIAVSLAEAVKANAVVFGAHIVDYSGYPDCRPEFIDSFQRTANLATKTGIEKRLIRIWPPLINMSKTEIIKTGAELGMDFSLTFSCYDPDEQGRACGLCDSCEIRRKGFAEAGIPDPTPYHS
jgi:7-cyano-7-deazaguanine synthase